MKAFITKYALTTGIEESEGEIHHGERMFEYAKSPGRMSRYAHGNDWHKTKETAIARAESMRVAKIASLRKSIAKLEKLSFTSP